MVSGVGSVIRVPADYSTIQDAINAALPGSTIIVSPGVYHENLTIDKTLNLTGEDKMTTIIDGGGNGTVVEIRANRVDFQSFTVQNSALSFGDGGVLLYNSSRCRISGNIIVHNSPAGVVLWSSHDNIIEGNIIAFSGIILPGWIWGWSIGLAESNNNTIVGNILSNSDCSINLEKSNATIIQFNVIQNSDVGISLWHSNDSIIDHNAFLNIRNFQIIMEAYNTTWSSCQEGNYWDDYIGLDDGSNDRIAGDSIGDTDLPHLGVDNYPLVRPPLPIPIVFEEAFYPVVVEGNSTVSAFRFVQAEKKLTFNVTGPTATAGYCNITIPKSLLRDSPWRIVLNGTDITAESFIAENETHSSIYFTYNHSISNVQIMGTWVVPEFSPQAMLTTMLVFAASMILLKARKREENNLSSSVQ